MESYINCQFCGNSINEIKIDLHEAQCKKYIKCKFCEELINREEYGIHENEHIQLQQELLEKEQNKQQLQQCEYCDLSWQKEEFDEHKDQCGSRTIRCIKCEKNIVRKKYQSHLKRHEQKEIKQQQKEIFLGSVLQLNKKISYDESRNIYNEQIKFLSRVKIIGRHQEIYQHIQVQDIIKSIEKLIRQVSEDYCTSYGQTVFILSKSDWNEKNISNTYSRLNNELYSEFEIGQQCSTECLICFEPFQNNNFYELACEHRSCKQCFKSYIESIVQGEKWQVSIFGKCIKEGCLQRVGRKEFELYLDKGKSLYDNIVLKNYLLSKQNIIECNRNCGYCLISNKVENLRILQINMKCQCEGYFCNLCLDDAHQPISCQTLKDWNQLIQGQNGKQMDSLWMKINTKNCPRCNVPIEKNQGCIHMKCNYCSFHFCWLCRQEFVNHESFYTCNFYQQEEILESESEDDSEELEDEKQGKTKKKQKIDKDREIIEKYNFYMERYLIYKKAVEFARKEYKQKFQNFQEVIELLTDENDIKQADLYFLTDYFELITEGKQALAYSYIFAYYNQEKDQNKIDFFLFLQSDFQNQIEKMDLEVYENPKEIDKKFIRREFGSVYINQEFFSFKKSILQKTQIMEKYLNQMLIGYRQEEIKKKLGFLEPKQMQNIMPLLRRNQSSFANENGEYTAEQDDSEFLLEQ